MSLDLASQISGAWQTTEEKDRRANARQSRMTQAKQVLLRLAKLKMEALQLYHPLPAVEPFHASMAKWRVLTGSNRSGKTNAGAIEYARCVGQSDPYEKYPKTGNSLVVGLDGDHIAMMFRKLNEPGAIMMIRDEHTKLWRGVRCDPGNPTELDPYDEAYREQWRPAPPLIPARIVRHIAWEDRAKGIPRSVQYTTGWKTLFRSSEGKAPQGDHYNFLWIDEEISNEAFYTEGCRGLVGLSESAQHMPRGIWTATPQTSNIQYLDLLDAASTDTEHVAAFKLLITDNPYIPPDEKQAFYDTLTEEEREVRWYGNPAMIGRRIYPHFSPMSEHGEEPFDIPSDWTRFCVLDPGRKHCGTIFAAVDPDEKHVWIYDEFDLRNGDATRWAQQVFDRQGEMRFEAFVIDRRMGRQHPPGYPTTVAEYYHAALIAVGVQPRVAGPMYGFFPGSDDIAAREEAVLDWLRIRGSDQYIGTPKLKVLRGQLPLLETQIRRAQMDTKNTNKRKKGVEDVLVCLEYLAAFQPYYHTPDPITKSPGDLVFEKFQAKQQRNKSTSPKSYQYA